MVGLNWLGFGRAYAVFLLAAALFAETDAVKWHKEIRISSRNNASLAERCATNQ